MFAVNITWPKSFYNPGQPSLGQYCNIHIFLSFLGSLIKTVILFETFVQFSFPRTPYNVQSWNSEKIQDTRVQHCLWGEGRVWPMWTWKRPRNASVPRLLSMIVVFPGFSVGKSFLYPLSLYPFSLHPLPALICTYTPCLLFLKLNDGLRSPSISMTLLTRNWQWPFLYLPWKS